MARRTVRGLGFGLAGALGVLGLTALVSGQVANSTGAAGAAAASILAAPTAAASSTPVADAAMAGDIKGVESLLKAGADVNSAQPDGMTALHWAVLNNDAPLAAMLLYAGADANATTRLAGYTPLDLAARDGHGALVQTLLKGGADPKQANLHGTTPLMFAAQSGRTEVITALLDASADVNAKETVKGETALMLASAYNRTDAVKLLLAHGADWRPTTKLEKIERRRRGARPQPPAGKDGKAADPAAEKGEPAAQSADKATKAKNSHASQNAQNAQNAQNGNDEEPSGPTTKGGLTALLFAARQGYMETAQALVAGGADVNEVDPGDQTSPLLMAIINGHYDLAKYLLEHGADPNATQTSDGVTPLLAVLDCEWAPKAGYPMPTANQQQQTSYLDLMKDLLARGAKPNVRLTAEVWYASSGLSGLDETGATPFWRAAYADDVQAMKLLVASGADPTIRTRKPAKSRHFRGLDPVDHSGLAPVAAGGPDIPPLLAASGEGYGWSLTSNSHHYASTGMLAAVKFLVEDLHADVNARDADGNTALHNAAARGDNAMILYLVSRGADITALNRSGQSVADMANGPVQRVNPYPETIALAERLGAKLLHKCFSCGEQ